jgi:NhaP-type Na+/H+ or K+/H+ antiporter
MKMSLGYHQVDTRSAIIEAVGLLILAVLFMTYLRGGVKPVAINAIAGFVTGAMVKFLLSSMPWMKRIERKAQSNEVQLWKGWNLVGYLLLPSLVTLSGLVAALAYRNSHILSLTILILAGFLGASISSLVRYQLRGRQTDQ